jgi:type IV pilus assembly protein PilV
LTLAETLVSIVVLAFGLLGILGIRMHTRADADTGARETRAVRLSEEDRVKGAANPDPLIQCITLRAQPADTCPTEPADCDAEDGTGPRSPAGRSHFKK